MTKEQAWNYAKGLIAVDDLEPTPEFMEQVEKEIKGEITMEEIYDFLRKKYKTQGVAEYERYISL